MVLVEIVDVSDGIDAVDSSVLGVTEVILYCVVGDDKVVRTVERLSADSSAVVEVTVAIVVS